MKNYVTTALFQEMTPQLTFFKVDGYRMIMMLIMPYRKIKEIGALKEDCI